MTFEVVLTTKAHEQLEAAHAWWAQHRSASQAARWYNEFARALVILAENPERWPLSAESGVFPVEIRDLRFGAGSRPTHRAVFTIRDGLILVLAIRHLAQRALETDDF
ncbi:MAG: type II toxin-antitoxin system RelE/ParE family toxin [Planctomycetia bacterium]|nr:type II toxin-antitoxin system RelE/ParE family toxin [Planctomycetia bacterium]